MKTRYSALPCRLLEFAPFFPLTYSLPLQLSVLSGLHFESRPATLHDGVQALLSQKALGRFRCTSRTALRHLRVLGLEISPDFLRIVGNFRFPETSPVCIPGLRSRPKTVDIQPNLVKWRHLTRFQSYFQSNPEKVVVRFGKPGAPNISGVLEKSPATAYEYMVGLFLCTTAIGKPSVAVHVRPLEPKSSCPQPPTFCKVKRH